MMPCFFTPYTGTSPPPAIGDIRLVKYTSETNFYEVLIYFTDGVQKPGWGAICASDINEARVICRQMGYQYKTFSSGYIYYIIAVYMHTKYDSATSLKWLANDS